MTRHLWWWSLWAIAQIVSLNAADAADMQSAQSPALTPGALLYYQNCVQCHEGNVDRAPSKIALGFKSPEAIYEAITSGVMRGMAARLSEDQRRSVAKYLSSRKFGEMASTRPPLRCKKNDSRWFDYARAPMASGWGMTNPQNARFIPDKVARLSVEGVKNLKLKWAFALPNATRARAQVAIAGGGLFVGSHDGTIFVLDAESGCLHWSLATGTEVRTAMTISQWQGPQPRKADRAPVLYFGDEAAYAYAVNAVTGQVLWKVKADNQSMAVITGAPTLYQARLYVPISSLEESLPGDPNYRCCTFRGSVVALEAATGQMLWQSFTIPGQATQRGHNARGIPQFGPSGAPVYNSPTIDERRQRLYVGTDNNYSSPSDDNSAAIFAFNLKDGSLAWKHQMVAHHVYNLSCRGDRINCPKEFKGDRSRGFSAPPSLIRDAAGKEWLVVLSKAGIVWGLNPENGATLWKNNIAGTSDLNFGLSQGGAHGGFGVATDGQRIFAPLFSNEDQRSVNDPGVRALGLHALDVFTGQSLWTVPVSKGCPKGECRGYSTAPTVIPGAVFAAANGYLRAFDPASGVLLWEFDTARDFTALNGDSAHGGSIEGSGPVIAAGMVYQSSGYDYAHGTTPGNALLAFSVNGK